MSPRRSLQKLCFSISLLSFMPGVSCRCCSRSAPRLGKSILENVDLNSVLIDHTQKIQNRCASPRQHLIDIVHQIQLCWGQNHAVALLKNPLHIC